jgi:heme oxygenase (biliverdin-producing, ferredoxin)
MTTATLPFSQLLRERTASVHAAAENAPFLLALAHGRVTPQGVTGLLQRLLPVYDALEGLAGRWRDDPAVAPLIVPGLERAEALRSDLASLGSDVAVASVAARDYAARIVLAGSESPQAYVAHHYTRYLGDLSGGQIIAAALRHELGLDLAFFDFPDLRGPAVKRAYREHLDGLPWTPAEQEASVAEAGVAFAHNQALAAELEAEVRG